ncbi:LysM peptidoglycan-binding domain-containing protein [Demequina sediminicola]|uniref:LysM peptidoglycan-binding domain-containing protein n=1 Tax=Demequina sediminicola TaxID=1095026 RepID=UPI000781EC2A|nr:LysM peptidoglycan-binding domain-containing protein [Demequina sediminicola]
MTAVAMTTPSVTRARLPRVRMVDTPMMRRRRRTVLVVLFAIVGAVFGPQAFAGNEPAEPAFFDTYTVSQGETLWSIASSFTSPGDDVRDTVAVLGDLNALESSDLLVGQQLRVPADD